MNSTKILTLCGLLVCSCAAINAQDYYGGNGSWRKQPSNNNNNSNQNTDEAEPSGYISVNFGFATPEGNFGQTYSQNAYDPYGPNPPVGIGYGNYAMPGTAFHFSLGVPINHSNFGVAFMFGSYANQYDINSYVNSLNNSPVSYNPYSPSPIAGYASAGGDNVYDESSIMGGFFATYPVGRFSFDGRLMIGALLCSLPEQDVYAEDMDGDALQYDVEPSNSTSLAFDVGVGVRFMVAQFGRRKLCLMVNADYLHSDVSYSTQQDLYVVPVSGNNAGYSTQIIPSPSVTGTLPIDLLNITFGIGYQL